MSSQASKIIVEPIGLAYLARDRDLLGDLDRGALLDLLADLHLVEGQLVARLLRPALCRPLPEALRQRLRRRPPRSHQRLVVPNPEP